MTSLNMRRVARRLAVQTNEEFHNSPGDAWFLLKQVEGVEDFTINNIDEWRHWNTVVTDIRNVRDGMINDARFLKIIFQIVKNYHIFAKTISWAFEKTRQPHQVVSEVPDLDQLYNRTEQMIGFLNDAIQAPLQAITVYRIHHPQEFFGPDSEPRDEYPLPEFVEHHEELPGYTALRSQRHR